MKLYLLEQPDAGLVKVGVSLSPSGRCAVLQTSATGRLFLRYEYDAKSRLEALRLERTVHFILAGARVTGEWFAVSVERALEAVQQALTNPPTLPRATTHTANTKMASVRLDAEELALLDKAAAKFDGNKTKAVVAGLRAVLDGKELSKAQLLMILQRRLR